MMNVDSIKVLLKMGLMVICASLIGLFFMWLVYLLPVEPMAENMLDSYDTIRAQDTWDDDYMASYEWGEVFDTGTNIIIFHEVIYPSSENAFEDSLLAPGANTWNDMGGDWTAGLMKVAEDRDYTDNTMTYARYWHGYLVLLKPLFLFMNLDGIYILNTFAIIALVAAVLYLMYKRLGMYAIAYLITILTMHPENIVQSIQLSSIFYALNITMLLILLKKDWNEHQIFYIFVFDGILVAFFDFLTYPFVALAIPMLTYILLTKKEKVLDYIILIFKTGISFLWGYAGMWAMKWIYATLFTTQNVIKDALSSVLHRTGVTEGANDVMNSGVGESIYRNFIAFFDDGNIVVLVTAIIVGSVFLVWKRKDISLHKNVIVLCGLILMSAFAWLIALNNHCSLHPHLEWRTYCIGVYAIAVALISMLKKEEINYG